MKDNKRVKQSISGQVIRVLFVCLGNICRSPTAHALFQAKVNEAAINHLVLVDSAGTGGWHMGAAPDQRAQQVALNYGYDMSHLQARQVTQDDFDEFDFILAMDKQNLHDLQQICPASYRGVLGLFLHESGIVRATNTATNIATNTAILEVPDPYYGDEKHFEHSIQLIADAVDGLLERIKKDYLV